jgi:glycosyltransferase involved in cell wall biosynthesis
MRICLVSVEIFAWGKYGGFGRATRLIGRELKRRGVEVYAVVPRRGDQRPAEELDGIRVLGFTPYNLLEAFHLYREIGADIYHSQEPSMGTYLAMKAMPGSKHLVTFRDQRLLKNWWVEFTLPSFNHLQVISNWLYEDNPFVYRAVRQADGWYAASHLASEQAKLKYRIQRSPEFLPTPVSMPSRVEKSERPTVCFVSRWDRRKRPERFLELARQIPQVHFIATGEGRDQHWDLRLRKKYKDVPNLEMTGFIDQFDGQGLSNILGKSWVLVNTSVRESLPNSFIEAAAHRCAILSAVDPDGFASRFGRHVEDDQFVQGMADLLENNRWQELGLQAYQYVNETFAIEKSIDQHLHVYRSLL